VREDGRNASLPLTRIGRVYAPIYRLREEAIQDAFEEVHLRGPDLVLAEPRLRESNQHESDTIKIFDDLIESALPAEVAGEDRQRCIQVLWSVMPEAQIINRAGRQVEALREEVWRPFEQRARVLASFGYIDFDAEKVNERGRWLADLHIDRPLLVGEALESGLLKSLDFVHLASVMAALTADDDRDYGELELADSLVSSLAQFEDIGFRVSTEEWKYGIEPAPELNFSAAGAAAAWATGSDWPTLAHETRAEEGDLFRMLSRTGESLLQIAGLKKAHPEAARLAAIAAEAILREPVR
jgi:hypothetical protein